MACATQMYAVSPDQVDEVTVEDIIELDEELTEETGAAV